jgi:hypothetical protein
MRFIGSSCTPLLSRQSPGSPCPGSRRPFCSGAMYNRPISVYRLGEMPIQSCGQRVSAPRGKAGARLNAHRQLRAKRQRLAREAIYRKRPIERKSRKRFIMFQFQALVPKLFQIGCDRVNLHRPTGRSASAAASSSLLM